MHITYTRKHFDHLAAAIKEANEKTKTEGGQAGVLMAASAIADALSTQSATFKKEAFLKACGF